MEDQNIKVLLLNIKNGIAKVESGTYDYQTLEDIKKDFLSFLELIKLFLIAKKDTYYGYFMMNMKFEVDFKSKCIAGIKLSSYPLTFVSNPLLLCKWSIQEILYAICHEMEHILLNHPLEMVKCNPDKDPSLYEKFNYAADACVNDRLDKEIQKGCRFMQRPQGAINSAAFSEIFKLSNVKKLENYLYYLNLIKDKDVPEDEKERWDSFGLPSSQGKEKEKESSDENKSNQGTNTSVDSDPMFDHRWADEDMDCDEIFANTKEFLNQSYNMMSAETKGDMPSSFLAEIQKINEPPKISWNRILKRYIGTIYAFQTPTRMRLNRRQPQRFDLSGKKNDKILKIILAIDTSCSINEKDISNIFNEIFAIVSKRKYEITVIECDCKIQRVYQVKNPNEIKKNVAGRGGTSYKPVIEYINSKRYFRDALLIYFTDGYGDFKIPKPLTYKNIWVLTQGDKESFSLKEPYGCVLSMED